MNFKRLKKTGKGHDSTAKGAPWKKRTGPRYSSHSKGAKDGRKEEGGY